MGKRQILIRLDEDLAEWVDAECARFDRKRPYVVASAIRFARDKGLDLASGKPVKQRKEKAGC
jgi:predicted transcriptional regulator